MRLIGNIGYSREPQTARINSSLLENHFQVSCSYILGATISTPLTSRAALLTRNGVDPSTVLDVSVRDAPYGGIFHLVPSSYEDDLYLWVYRASHHRAKVHPQLCENAVLIFSEGYGNCGFFVAPRSTATPKVVFKYREVCETAIIEEGVVTTTLTKEPRVHLL